MNRLFTLLLAACGLVVPAFGQRFEVGVFAGWPRIAPKPLGSTSPESRADDDTRLHLSQILGGGRFTINSTGYYGHELSYWRTTGRITTVRRVTENRVQTTTIYEDRIKVQNAAYNFLIYFMPAGEKFRPFITGGVHAQQFNEPSAFDEFWTRGRSRNYGANYGGGLKIQPVKHLLLRTDFRHFINGKPWDLEFADFRVTGGLIGTMEFSAGFSFTF
jgi:hypothetical protein